MSNNFVKRTEYLRKQTESLKRRASVFSSISKIDDKGTSASLRYTRTASSPGKKLQKIGFIIFWIPEPTMISNAVAGPMILAGKYLDKRYNPSTIKDIGSEVQNNAGTMHHFKDSVF